MPSEVFYAIGGDWNAIYVDGKKKWEGDYPGVNDLCEALGIPYKDDDVNLIWLDARMDTSLFPEDLSEVKF